MSVVIVETAPAMFAALLASIAVSVLVKAVTLVLNLDCSAVSSLVITVTLATRLASIAVCIVTFASRLASMAVCSVTFATRLVSMAVCSVTFATRLASIASALASSVLIFVVRVFTLEVILACKQYPHWSSQ